MSEQERIDEARRKRVPRADKFVDKQEYIKVIKKPPRPLPR